MRPTLPYRFAVYAKALALVTSLIAVGPAFACPTDTNLTRSYIVGASTDNQEAATVELARTFGVQVQHSDRFETRSNSQGRTSEYRARTLMENLLKELPHYEVLATCRDETGSLWYRSAIRRLDLSRYLSQEQRSRQLFLQRLDAQLDQVRTPPVSVNLVDDLCQDLVKAKQKLRREYLLAAMVGFNLREQDAQKIEGALNLVNDVRPNLLSASYSALDPTAELVAAALQSRERVQSDSDNYRVTCQLVKGEPPPHSKMFRYDISCQLASDRHVVTLQHKGLATAENLSSRIQLGISNDANRFLTSHCANAPEL